MGSCRVVADAPTIAGWFTIANMIQAAAQHAIAVSQLRLKIKILDLFFSHLLLFGMFAFRVRNHCFGAKWITKCRITINPFQKRFWLLIPYDLVFTFMILLVPIQMVSMASVTSLLLLNLWLWTYSFLYSAGTLFIANILRWHPERFLTTPLRNFADKKEPPHLMVHSMKWMQFFYVNHEERKNACDKAKWCPPFRLFSFQKNRFVFKQKSPEYRIISC